MSNYSLVANSVFQPFSYQELAAPLDRQEAYHEKLAEEYDKLSSQADILEVMGANDRDKKSGAYSKYKAYSDFLRSEADHLYQHGLDIDSRERLTDLRRRYNTDIIPIHNAWKKRETEAATQQQALLNNPHLMFTRDADKTSLDDYLTNPMGGYGVVNGATITAQMSQMAGTLAKKIRNGEKVDIDPYTYDYIRKYGLTEDLIRDWRNNPSLSKMFEQVMKANGVTPEALANSMNAQSIIDRSTNYAEMGMWSAIGEDKAQVLENFGSRLAAQEAKEKRVAAYQHALSNPNPVNPDIPGAPGDHNKLSYPDPQSAGSAARNKLANLAADFMENYFENNGSKGFLGKANRTKNKALVTALRAAGDIGIDMNNPEVRRLGKQNPQLLKQMKNYLKQNFDGNEELVDMWLGGRTSYNSGAASGPTPEERKRYETAKKRRTPEDTAFASEYVYKYGPDGNIKHQHNGSSAPSWDKFDEKAHNGYFMTTTAYNDNQTALGNKLAGIITNQMQTGSDNIPLYEIKGNNTATGRVVPGNKKLTLSDLPQDTQGNVKWEDIRRQDSGPDWILSWIKDGHAHRAVLRREDMGLLANEDRATIVAAQRSAENLFKAGILSRSEYEKQTKRLGNNLGQQGFGMQQGVKISDFDVTKQWGFDDYFNPYSSAASYNEDEEE